MDPQPLPPPRRLSARTFEPDDIDLLMRTSPRQFTAEEITALASFDLPDPDPEVWQQLTKDAASAPQEARLADFLPGAAAAEATAPYPSRPTTAQQRARGARLGESLPLPSSAQPHPPPLQRRHEEGMTDANVGLASSEAAQSGTLITGRRLSQQLHQKPSPSSELAGVDDTKRIFSVLSRQDLVGGPETVAEAILNTRFVDLSDRDLTTTASAECFLNATHVYLQHNQLTDVDGLLLLAQLRVLVVHHNQITSLTPLAVLDALMYLDARDNMVERLDAEWDLPRTSLQYLNLLGNPCCPVPREAIVDGVPSASVPALPAVQHYRRAIESACPELEVLDEIPTEAAEGTSSSSSTTEGEGDEKDEEPPQTRENGEDTKEEKQPPASRTSARKPTKPAKPSTAPSGVKRRSAQCNTSQSPVPPRRASDGVTTRTHNGSGKSAATGTGSTKSRPQQRLEQLRAEASQTAVDKTPPGQCRVGSPPTKSEDTPSAVDIAHREADDSSEVLKKALQAKRDSLTAGAAISDDEARLLQQFQMWAQSRRAAVLATLDDVEEQGEADDDVNRPQASAAGAPRRPYSSSDDAAYMQSKMYLDVEFADKVARDRLERSLEDTWAGVAKVRQTRTALLAERRRQQRETLNEHSKAYQDTLQLLKKEGFTENLDPYRVQKGPQASD